MPSALNSPARSFRSGFIAIIGLPNVGKSTLLNRILDQKIAITTPKPQTTRNRILGIKNLPGAQLILIDTPGVHRTSDKFNARLVKTALGTLNDVNAILWLMEATSKNHEEESLILEAVKKVSSPVILVFNKIDLIRKGALLPLMDRYSHVYSFSALMPVSALSGEGVKELMNELLSLMPEGPQYYPPDMITDLPERFLAAELIREKVTLYCSQEVPYAVAVTMDSFEDKPEQNLVVIHAVIQVERPSQRGILIGKQGAMLKRIGERARQDIERLLGARVFLHLFVQVARNWRSDENQLRRLGY
jgi:GTP-binding protein Era